MNKGHQYRSMSHGLSMNRRNFLKTGGVTGAGLILGRPHALWPQDPKPERPETNIGDALKTARGPHAIPGPFPGRVVAVEDREAMINDQPQADVINSMFERGLTTLTGKNMRDSFPLFFTKKDSVGIKVNPVGAGLISTRHEVVGAIVDWLTANGIKRNQIVIWDRFDYMLEEAGFTVERYPGLQIEGLQTMDEEAIDGTHDDSRWLDRDGIHLSFSNFDKNVYYWADVDGPQDKAYLNQHVVNGRYSYFGKLLTSKLTKIINVPVFKNTGNGISMATKNLGYGSICNTGRLHRPLFFDVCTEVLAFPVIRDKLVLNITDGLRAQYDGGPSPAAEFSWVYNHLFFSTDPFALDAVCHDLLIQKRKEMNVKVNEHPRFTEYLHYGQKLGLGIADRTKIDHIRV